MVNWVLSTYFITFHHIYHLQGNKNKHSKNINLTNEMVQYTYEKIPMSEKRKRKIYVSSIKLFSLIQI